MSYYTHFKIYWPDATTKFTPDEPRTDLLQGVIDCGVIPADVIIEYFEQDNNDANNPLERYGSSYKPVPDDIREQARAQWNFSTSETQ